MRLRTPYLRKDGDLQVETSGGYGKPHAAIWLDEDGGTQLEYVHLDDLDRLGRAVAVAKESILRHLDEMAAPHGRGRVYQGTCQLCGKPEDDELHAESRHVYRLACGCTDGTCTCPGCKAGRIHEDGAGWHCDEHGKTAIAGLAQESEVAA